MPWRTKHGMAGTPEYRQWSVMLARCRNPNRKDYPRYGGKGITVCQRWQDSFVSFHEDMGARPSPDHSIDRIKNHKGYEPVNCRWATWKEQGRNRVTNRLITLTHVTMPLCAWSEMLGIHRGVIAHRLKVGWSVREALTTPTGGARAK